MRTYIILLSEISNETCDAKFFEYVNKTKLDFWRYTPLNWILLTPDDISTNMLTGEVALAYGGIVCCVLEVNILDSAGIFNFNIPIEPMPQNTMDEAWSPFVWFSRISDPGFIPRWERESEKNIDN